MTRLPVGSGSRQDRHLPMGGVAAGTTAGSGGRITGAGGAGGAAGSSGRSARGGGGGESGSTGIEGGEGGGGGGVGRRAVSVVSISGRSESGGGADAERP